MNQQHVDPITYDQLYKKLVKVFLEIKHIDALFFFYLKYANKDEII